MQRRARWERYFDINKLETRIGDPHGHKFGNFISSDGIGVSVKMTRTKVRWNLLNNLAVY